MVATHRSHISGSGHHRYTAHSGGGRIMGDDKSENELRYTRLSRRRRDFSWCPGGVPMETFCRPPYFCFRLAGGRRRLDSACPASTAQRRTTSLRNPTEIWDWLHALLVGDGCENAGHIRVSLRQVDPRSFPPRVRLPSFLNSTTRTVLMLADQNTTVSSAKVKLMENNGATTAVTRDDTLLWGVN